MRGWIRISVYTGMLVGLLLSMYWFAMPDPFFTWVKKIDPNYELKRSDSYNWWVKTGQHKDEFFETHDGYFWFKIANDLYELRDRKYRHKVQLGFYLLFLGPFIVYRRWLRQKKVAHVFIDVLSVFFLIFMALIIVIRWFLDSLPNTWV